MKGKQVRLLERAGLTGATVDKENSVIHGVRVLNPASSKKRDYSNRALGDVARLAEGAHVFDQHDRNTPTAGRRTRDQLAILRGTKVQEGGVVGDLHVSAREAWLLEDAERIPESVMLSINALGRATNQRGSGRLLVESVAKMNSVDLVPAGGTTSSLFESRIEEEEAVDLKDLTLTELRAERADLVAAITESAIAEAGADDEREKRAAQLETQVKELTESAAKDKKELDELKVEKAIAARKATIQTKLDESELPEAAVTEGFVTLLEGLADDEAVDAAIDERKTLVEGATGFTG